MNITCDDRERIFLDGTSEEWVALEAHASNCSACREGVAAWKKLSFTASEMHEEWDSPALWLRSERALAAQSTLAKASWCDRLLGTWNLTSLEWQTAAAVILLVLLSASAVWFVMRSNHEPMPPNQTLLSNRTVREVEKAEA